MIHSLLLLRLCERYTIGVYIYIDKFMHWCKYIYIIYKPPVIKLLQMLCRVFILTTSSNMKQCKVGRRRAHQDKTHLFFYESYFACFVVFSPVPTISWRRADGKQIPRKARRHRSSGLLEIPNFQQEDAGLYECVAENVRGKNVARGQLIFYGKQTACFWGGLLYQVQPKYTVRK